MVFFFSAKSISCLFYFIINASTYKFCSGFKRFFLLLCFTEMTLVEMGLSQTLLLFLLACFVDVVKADVPNQTAVIVGTILGFILIACIVGAFVYLWVSLAGLKYSNCHF